MKRIAILLSFTLIVSIIFFSSCADDCANNCLPPEGIGIDTATVDLALNQNLITFSWSPAPQANSYNLSIFVDDILHEYVDSIIGTSHIATFNPSLFIDSKVSAIISSNCNCLQSQDSPIYDFYYKNGGGTLDIVPLSTKKTDMCNSTCEYVRFLDQLPNGCVKRPYTSFVFYNKNLLCQCLGEENNLSETLCEFPNFKDCLKSSGMSIKTGGIPCSGPKSPY